MKEMTENLNAFLANSEDKTETRIKFNDDICKFYSEILSSIKGSLEILEKWQLNLPSNEVELLNDVGRHQEYLQSLSIRIKEEWRIYNREVGNPNYQELRDSWSRRLDQYELRSDSISGSSDSF